MLGTYQRLSFLQAESDESREPNGGSRATSASAEGALTDRQRRSGSKLMHTPASSAPGARAAKRAALAALRSPEGVSLGMGSIS